jgi:hypothetical protein
MNKKAWHKFEAQCKELERRGVLELPGKRMRLSQEFQRRIFAFAENPPTDEAKREMEDRPLYYLKICSLAALVSFYDEIKPCELKEKWNILEGLVNLNTIKAFQKENR